MRRHWLSAAGEHVLHVNRQLTDTRTGGVVNALCCQLVRQAASGMGLRSALGRSACRRGGSRLSASVTIATELSMTQ